MIEWLKRRRKTHEVSEVHMPVPSVPAIQLTAAEIIGRMVSVNIDRDTFFLLFSKLVEESYKVETISFTGDGILSVKLANASSQTQSLSNLWLMCRNNPEEARSTIERYLRMLADIGEVFVPQREQIVPMIKDHMYVQYLGENTKVAYEHLAADIYVIYAADTKDFIKTVTWESLLALGLERENVRQLAIENLKRILPEITSNDQGHWHFLSAGQDYASSLLLLDAVWEFAAGQVEGDVVAVVPTRDSVMFTGASSAEGLAVIRRIAADLVVSGHHVISDTLLRRVEGGWKAFG